MNKAKFLFAVILVASVAAQAAEIKKVIVRQQWPWSSDIKVEYVLSGVTVPVDIGVTVLKDSAEVELPANSVRGDLYGVAQSQVGTITIDAAKVFGSEKVKTDDLKVQLSLSDSKDDINEVLYKVFDLTTGACEDITRRQLLNGEKGDCETDYGKIGSGFTTPLSDVLIWTGVANDVKYKTTHLVMRKIKAAGKTWCSGDQDEAWYSHATLEPKIWVKLTYDYYISVFETTQAQYKLMNGGKLPSGCGYIDEAGLNPVNGMARYDLIGHQGTEYTSYWGVLTGELVLFPTNSYVRDVGKISICNNMWNKTRTAGKCYEFNLPTGAEWEFACRAGSSKSLYSGKAVSETAACELAWIGASNSGNTLKEVATRKPNAYGLYDMLGNALEHVSLAGTLNSGRNSGGTGDTEDDPVIDPYGSATTGGYAMAGGGAATDSGYPVYEGQWTDARPTARRYICEWYNWRTYTGFRFVIPARDDGQWADHPAK